MLCRIKKNLFCYVAYILVSQARLFTSSLRWEKGSGDSILSQWNASGFTHESRSK